MFFQWEGLYALTFELLLEVTQSPQTGEYAPSDVAGCGCRVER